MLPLSFLQIAFQSHEGARWKVWGEGRVTRCGCLQEGAGAQDVGLSVLNL